jgi:hypothetical protein
MQSMPDELKDYLDLYGPEDLHPELARCVGVAPRLGMPALRHPLIYAVPYFPAQNKMLNAGLALKQKSIAEHYAKAELESLVFLFERPYRLDGLLQALPLIGPLIDDKTYWKVVRRVWTDSENVHENWATWKKVWRGDIERQRLVSRQMATRDEDRAALAAMPDELQVWHGEEHPKRVGMSWTLDRRTAVWFAGRFGKQGGKLYEGVVRRSDVIAYITSRGEEEILVEPDTVKLTSCKRL